MGFQLINNHGAKELPRNPKRGIERMTLYWIEGHLGGSVLSDQLLISAQVMISRLVRSNPVLGSTLIAWSLLGILPLSLSLSLNLSLSLCLFLCLSPSLSLSQKINLTPAKWNTIEFCVSSLKTNTPCWVVLGVELIVRATQIRKEKRKT